MSAVMYACWTGCCTGWRRTASGRGADEGLACAAISIFLPCCTGCSGTASGKGFRAVLLRLPCCDDEVRGPQEHVRTSGRLYLLPCIVASIASAPLDSSLSSSEGLLLKGCHGVSPEACQIAFGSALSAPTLPCTTRASKTAVTHCRFMEDMT